MTISKPKKAHSLYVYNSIANYTTKDSCAVPEKLRFCTNEWMAREVIRFNKRPVYTNTSLHTVYIYSTRLIRISGISLREQFFFFGISRCQQSCFLFGTGYACVLFIVGSIKTSILLFLLAKCLSRCCLCNVWIKCNSNVLFCCIHV